jgi:3-oxoacyl-[acyl-carrier protein] reductase
MTQPKVALVTGVGRTRGIGAAIAKGLAEDGWDLGLAYWNDYDQRVHGEPGDAEAVLDQLGGGTRAVLLPGDLSVPSTPEDLVQRLNREIGTVRAVVMCHCESVDSSLLTTTVESFDRHYAVNVRATWLLIKAFAEQLDDRGGSIVGLTSDHTVHNLPYGATKGALDRVVLAATHELADLDVRANVINPGPVDTGWMDDQVRASGAAATPGGRLGGPETTADMVRFLLSEQGRWINGQLLLSNGGFKTPAV